MKRQNLSLLFTVLLLSAPLTNAYFAQAAYPFDYPESVNASGIASGTVSEISKSCLQDAPADKPSVFGFENVEPSIASGGVARLSSQATSPAASFPAMDTELQESFVASGIGAGYAPVDSDFRTELPPEAMSEPIFDEAAVPSSWRITHGSRRHFGAGFCPGIVDMGSSEPWTWHCLPDNVIYKTYMACKREPRMGIQFVGTNDLNYWDCSLGGRMSIIRFGTDDPLYPEGWELEIDGAAFPRLTLDDERELWSCDYRFGVPIVYRMNHWEYMFGYYHISSHMGDERMVRYNSLDRLNYVRDCLMAGIGYRPNYDWRFFFHTEYAVWRDGGARPWHLIFGFDYSPMQTNGFHGSPFLAMCARLREDIDFSGSFSLETGWQWRSAESHVFRTGLFYFNGYSDHYQFYKQYEHQIGLGFWYDF